MVTIGLTGPSGAGKSAVASIMQAHGLHVIDADKVYSDVIAPPSPCLDELVSNFGAGILTHDGRLDRAALSHIVFSQNSGEKLELLNSITHKYVVERIRSTVSCVCSVAPTAYVIDAPLLIEAGLDRDCIFTVAVIADKQTRINRIALRDGISLERATARIESQKSDDFYVSQCDYTVYNNGDIAKLTADVLSILKDRSIV